MHKVPRLVLLLTSTNNLRNSNPMKVIPETTDDLILLVAANFRSFGGGHVTRGNPLSHALQDAPPQFAAGVDIREVVEFVLKHQPTLVS